MKRIVRIAICMMLVMTMLITTLAPAAMAAAKIMKVNASGVRLHYNANGGGTSSMITSLSKGTKVLYMGTTKHSWYKVRTNSGLTGYIFKDYLSSVEKVSKSKCFVVKDRRLTTYKSAGGRKYGTIKGGTTVIVTKTSGQYVKIKTLTGKEYFVKKSGLKKLF